MARLFAVSLAVVLAATFVWAEDWQSLLRNTAAANDPITRRTSNDRLALVLNDLVSAKADDVALEVRRLVPVTNDADPIVRLNAIAILETLAMARTDGSAILGEAIPALLNGFVSEIVKIRRASVGAIVNIKPALPGRGLGNRQTGSGGFDSCLCGAECGKRAGDTT